MSRVSGSRSFRARALLKWTIAASIGVCLGTTSSRAAIAPLFDWQASGTIDLSSVFIRPLVDDARLHEAEVTERQTFHALFDRENRIAPEFKVPAGLHTKVGFWLRVYTRYSSHQVVVYDKRHPEVVYDVIDFLPLSKEARNGVVYEILRERRINRVIRRYQEAFDNLSRKQKRSPESKPVAVSPVEERILAALARSPHRHSFHYWSEGLRTQTGQRDFVIHGLNGYDRFAGRMERIFESMGIPKELTRVSLVESSFNLIARSKVGATGVWQFMPASGKEFLTVARERGVDERLSPLKSTVAAAKLFRRNFKMLDSWELAVIAYNSGHGPVWSLGREKVSREELARMLGSCSAKMRLGMAGRNYYPEFLAMLHAEAYRELFFGIPHGLPETGIVYRPLAKAQSALAFIRSAGVSLQDFRRLNPDVRRLDSKLPRGFLVALPGLQDDFSKLVPRQRTGPSDGIRTASVLR